jgi:hypothetical protein
MGPAEIFAFWASNQNYPESCALLRTKNPSKKHTELSYGGSGRFTGKPEEPGNRALSG